MLQVALNPPFRIHFENKKQASLEAYLEFCRANPDLRVERTAEGEIVTMAPAGAESSHRNSRLTSQLVIWAERDGRGVPFDSSAQFVLRDGSALSPDASWISRLALNALSPKQRREFPRLAPEFVVEVLSPSDRLNQARKKMELWIANGVQLAWLIDGDNRTVYIYRPGREPETKKSIQKLKGEGPVEGFVLNLKPIWKGLV